MLTHFYSLRDVAEVLKTQPYKIVYLLTTKKVAEPQRVGGKRLFTIHDLHQIAEQMGIENVEELFPQQRRGDVE